MPGSPANRGRRLIRWVSAGTVFVLMPKCIACLAGYVGVGALFGIKLGPEICGASADPAGSPYLWLTILTLLIGIAFASVREGLSRVSRSSPTAHRQRR